MVKLVLNISNSTIHSWTSNEQKFPKYSNPAPANTPQAVSLMSILIDIITVSINKKNPEGLQKVEKMPLDSGNFQVSNYKPKRKRNSDSFENLPSNLRIAQLIKMRRNLPAHFALIKQFPWLYINFLSKSDTCSKTAMPGSTTRLVPSPFPTTSCKVKPKLLASDGFWPHASPAPIRCLITYNSGIKFFHGVLSFGSNK